MYLGIDIGSTYIKSALLDVVEGSLSAVQRHKTPKFLQNPDKKIREYDPNELLASVIEIIDSYIVMDDIVIDGILFSTQMHGFILTDGEGHAATNCVSWQDERGYCLMPDGHETCLEAIERILPYNLTKASGCTPKINQSISPLFCYVQSHDIKGLRFMMMGDYIAYQLTGELGGCHITNAASTGMADVRAGVWSEGICELLGLSGMELPKIVHEVEFCGKYKGIDLYTAVGDQQASVLGLCDIGDCDIIINIATGTQVCALSESFVRGSFETRPYFDGRYLLTFPELPSGRGFDAIVDKIALKRTNITREDIWREVNAVMEEILTDNGFSFDIDEKSVKDSNGEVAEAAFELIAEYKNLAEKIKVAVNELPRDHFGCNIVLTGGAVHKSLALSKVLEEALKRKITVSVEKEDCLKGLLKIAQRSADVKQPAS